MWDILIDQRPEIKRGEAKQERRKLLPRRLLSRPAFSSDRMAQPQPHHGLSDPFVAAQRPTAIPAFVNAIQLARTETGT
jgi:hypothetical protein